MIRRVVGVAHVEDLEGIKDRATKVECESHALKLGRRLAMVCETSDGGLATPQDVCALAQSLAPIPAAAAAAAGGGGGGAGETPE